MSRRTLALAVMTTVALAACSDDAPLVAPDAETPAFTHTIDPADFCTGATMPAIECEALVALYNTTGGAEWGPGFGWGVYANPCHWSGVTCTTPDVGWVEELRLPGLGLEGPVPPELGNLAALKELILYGNSLTGPIPAELGNLSNLHSIRFYANQLSGPIPAALGNLSNLELLDLSWNEITGEVPATLGDLTNLRELRLSFNPLSGGIPATLGNLSSLESLELSDAGLSGPLPASLGNLANLRVLWAPRNDFTGSIPGTLGGLTNLEYLDFGASQLTGTIPPELGSLANLETLALGENQLTGPIPPELGNLSQLEYLMIASNRLDGPIPAELADLTSLEWFSAQYNQLAGLLPLPVAAAFDQLTGSCGLHGNDDLYVPDTEAYRSVDFEDDGDICGLPFSTAEDIGEDAIEDIDELVPDVLNEGQANALKSKIENAIAKAAAGQYNAAINQMQAFISQLNEMVAGGTLTSEQAAPFLDQAELLIAIWTALL